MCGDFSKSFSYRHRIEEVVRPVLKLIHHWDSVVSSVRDLIVYSGTIKSRIELEPEIKWQGEPSLNIVIPATT